MLKSQLGNLCCGTRLALRKATFEWYSRDVRSPIQVSACHAGPSRQAILKAILLSVFLAKSADLGVRPSQAVVSGEDRRGIGRYIKRKKLEALDTYVPAVIAARNQLNRAGSIMKDDLQAARELLRSGAFDGLRDNIRAIGEYAEQNGKKDAKGLSDKFFLAIQGFDFTLFQAKRYDQPVGLDSEKALQTAMEAFQSLLATVPEDILASSEKIVKAVEESFMNQPPAPRKGEDKQLDQLMQLVPNQTS